MITIGICTENPSFTGQLYNIINEVMFSVDEWNARIFSTNTDLLNALKNDAFDCDIIFLDLLTKDDTIWNTVEFLRQNHPDIDIISVSESTERAGKNGVTYLTKPVADTEIRLELQKRVESRCQSSQYFPVSYHGITHRIPLASILYIESNLRKLKIHTKQADFYCYQKLGDAARILEPLGFIRCHQSYLVAIDKISRLTDTSLYVQDIHIPISYRYQAKTKKTLKTISQEPTSDIMRSIPRDHGTLVCIQGSYAGSMIRFYPEQKILLGRDGTSVDIVINLPLVSRIHCSIVYHEDTMEYELTDFSSNGTFINGEKRLLTEDTYLIHSGTKISFGDVNTIFQLQ